jgi:hypothetical protein
MEEAGFVLESGDSLEAWTYSSGFPKSLDASAAIDRQANATVVPAIGRWLEHWREEAGLSRTEVAEALGVIPTAVYNWEVRPLGAGFCTREHWEQLRVLYGFDGTWDDFKRGAVRESLGKHPNPASASAMLDAVAMGAGWRSAPDLTAPATEAARCWDGWGTAIKPSWESVVVGHRP